MLVLTDKATEVIRTLIESPETSEESGLRISSQKPATSTDQLQVAWAEGAEDDDQVIEEAGARVLLGPNAVKVLDDKLLDAKVASDGAVQFTISDQ